MPCAKPRLSLPGLALSLATNSLTELAGTSAPIVRMQELRAMNAIGVKSFCGSYSCAWSGWLDHQSRAREQQRVAIGGSVRGRL